MEFGWINGINLTAVILLILINIVALKTGDAEGFSSKYRIINVLEQIGRYGCMIFMVLPIWIRTGSLVFNLLAKCFFGLLLLLFFFCYMASSGLKSAGAGSALCTDWPLFQLFCF